MRRLVLGFVLAIGMLLSAVTSASAHTYCSVDPTVGVGTPVGAVGRLGLGRLIGAGALCIRRNPATGTRRRIPIDLVFNAGQLMVAAAAGAVIFQGVAAAMRDADGAGLFLAATAAAVAMYVVNTTLVVVAAALNSQRSPFQVWAEAA